MREDQAGEFGDLDRVISAAFFLVGQAKQRQGDRLFGVPDAFNGSDLGGLVFECVQAV